ncbi:BTB/POZ and MATH domain-containing protein 1-like [Dorcoceras hygrometricum]|uniref:BTB/POZ and MATH domain-containing protein 1-like n=1 Tax=Dorcoceras hygrometricum TaxID=472368 RepID=A0A2Z7A3C5_9LAMI|nr:BTB/POZ and MATH domain-containing protein 1-like [Dorcoceras hygrometricum]
MAPTSNRCGARRELPPTILEFGDDFGYIPDFDELDLYSTFKSKKFVMAPTSNRCGARRELPPTILEFGDDFGYIPDFDELEDTHEEEEDIGLVGEDDRNVPTPSSPGMLTCLQNWFAAEKKNRTAGAIDEFASSTDLPTKACNDQHTVKAAPREKQTRSKPQFEEQIIQLVKSSMKHVMSCHIMHEGCQEYRGSRPTTQLEIQSQESSESRTQRLSWQSRLSESVLILGHDDSARQSCLSDYIKFQSTATNPENHDLVIIRKVPLEDLMFTASVTTQSPSLAQDELLAISNQQADAAAEYNT